MTFQIAFYRSEKAPKIRRLKADCCFQAMTFIILPAL